MNNEDFDLEKFIDLFDTAMSSDNPTVKRAFKNLMLVAALADSENENTNGPLRDLVEKVKSLEGRIAAIEWRTNVGIGSAGGAGSIPYPAVWTTTSSVTGSTGLSNTYTFTGPSAGTNPTSISTTNYTASSNYDNLYETLSSKN